MEKIIEISLNTEKDKIYTSGLLLFTPTQLIIKSVEGIQAEIDIKHILTIRMVDKPLNE